MSARDYAQSRMDSMNTTPGKLNETDGYNCPLCLNRGYFMKLVDANNTFYETAYDCNCMTVRRSILRMKKSGLQDVIRDCTFDKWETREEWQQNLKTTAMEYANNPQGWFFIGGQPGSGKTRICTTICRELLLSGKELFYMQWRDESGNLKKPADDPEERKKRDKRLDELKTAEVLYIDDLFKCGKKQDGTAQRPTPADINLAFEIINYRYNKPDSLTIISSELTPLEMIEIDEATGSRISERANCIEIERNKRKNYRIQKLLKF